MLVKSLKLVNYRNYQSFFIEFDSHINILIGKNAQGKTNLIEAVYLLSLGRSFRSNVNKQLVMFDKEFARVTGKVFSNRQGHLLEMIIGQDFKKIKVDEQVVKRISEYIGYLNVVVFVPDDLYLIKGDPRNRRRFIDLELTKISPIYVFNLNKYTKLLKERNKYLKMLNQRNQTGDAYLEVLSEQMAKLQVDLINRRTLFIDKLSDKVNRLYGEIAGDSEKIVLRYDCFLKDNDNNFDNIINLYNRYQSRDIKNMTTNIGVHKDDLAIFLNDKLANLYASQGQQRTIVLAIKIALIEIIKEEIGEYPVLLLDDVLSELDANRKTMLLNLLNEKIQTFITTTSVEGIDHEIVNKARKFYIENGQLGG